MKLNPRNMTPEARTALADMLTKVLELANEDPIAIERVAGMFEREPQVEALTSSLIGLLPVELDSRRWNDWLSGGPAPSAGVKLVDPDLDRKTSARGAQHSAAARRAAARHEVDLAREKLEAAEAHLVDCNTVMRETSTQLRMVVAYRMIIEAVRLFVAPFSLGPMWTVARAISGYLRRDIAYEATLDSVEMAVLEEHRLKRKETSAKILELLDFYCGDVALEVKLHRMLIEVLEEHHRPVAEELAVRSINKRPLSAMAKRVKRRSEERRGSVRPGAPIMDRKEVLDGLTSAGSNDEHASGAEPFDGDDHGAHAE